MCIERRRHGARGEALMENAGHFETSATTYTNTLASPADTQTHTFNMQTE